MYDGAVKADPPMRILDVRHEQTAAFRRRGHGQAQPDPRARRVDRRPRCHQRGQRDRPGAVQRFPLVVVGGRAPANRWGSARSRSSTSARSSRRSRRWRAPSHRRRGTRRDARGVHPCGGPRTCGPVFVDVPMDEFFQQHRRRDPWRLRPHTHRARPGRRSRRWPSCSARRSDRCSCSAPDVWGRWRRGGRAAPRRGGRPARDHQRHGGVASYPVDTHCWSQGPERGARRPPTWSSWSARRSTSGWATGSSEARTAPRPPASSTSPTPRTGLPARRPHRPGVGRPHPRARRRPRRCRRLAHRPDWNGWVQGLQDTVRQAVERDATLLGAEADPIHPAGSTASSCAAGLTTRS